jgi:ABC-2 type transport system ATP-binding protein
MIEAVNLTKTFGEFTAVRGVSLFVPPGQIMALLGHNGAGKTTTTRMLSAILRPTDGHARIAGFDTLTHPLEVRRNIGHLTEMPGLYNRMRIIEYLDFFGELQEIDKTTRQERIEKYLHQFDLWDTRGLRLGEYSKGMRQKTALIRALIHEPKVLFLDEPTSAMDPHSAKTVRDAIAQLKDDNRSIILCTHNLFEAESLADRITIIRKGQIITEGTSAELKHNLLGSPHYTVKLDRPLTNGLPMELDSLLQITEKGADSFTFKADEPKILNPYVLRTLVRNNYNVISISEVPRSLEAVYLKLAGTPQEPADNRDEVEFSLAKLNKRTKKNRKLFGRRNAKSPEPEYNESDFYETGITEKEEVLK